jgi:arylsulfatase A-like enzyme
MLWGRMRRLEARVPLRLAPRRFHFLLLEIAAATAVTFACAARAEGAQATEASADARRPNFLVIVTDDQRHDVLGVVQREQGERGRFPWMSTPAVDRLAAEGVRFRQAFVVNSLCSPSRASILTGRYPHEVGVLDNRTPFPADVTTFAQRLRAGGYRTAYVGKWHMGRQAGPRPGFEFSASYLGHGEYFDCPFEVNGVATPTKGWVDDVATEFAERFIREHSSEPFLAFVGFKSGHHPFEPPERRRGAYEDAQVRPTPNLVSPAVYTQRKPGRSPRAVRREKEGEAREEGEDASAEGPDHGYFETLSAADDALGRLLALLDELQLARDTLVLFTSDNGMYFGEHGLRDKRTAYEESVRTPLLVRYPRRVARGAVLDELALSIDIAPTLLDYAGLDAPPELRGRSLRPLLEPRAGAPAPPWRNSFFYGYVAERGYAAPTVTAVRTARHKLVVYPGHAEWTELFDLDSDPYELNNLAGDEKRAELRGQLEKEHARWIAELAFPGDAQAPQKPALKPPETPPAKVPEDQGGG